HQGNVSITCDDALHNLSTNIAQLNGNVVLTQDTMIITAPHAVYNANTHLATADGGVRLTDHVIVLTASNGTYDMETHIATFHNNVKIVNDTAVITSNDLTYNRLTEISFATDNVKIVDSSGIITCDRLTNDRIDQRSYCGGNVCVRSRTDRSLIFGDTLFHDSRKNYSHIPLHPVLVHIDSSATDKTDSLGGHTQYPKYDTTFIISKTMDAIRGDSEIYNAYDSVRVLRPDISARGNEAHYFRSASAATHAPDIMTLSKNPIVWYNETQLTGDSITLFLKNNRLQKLVSDRNAFGISQSDSVYPLRFNQLAGARLTMYFQNDSLDNVRVEKNAISVYFGFDSTKPKGANRMSGDTIVIAMKRGKPDQVYTLGGGEGQYFPEKLVRKNEPDYRLTGFEWLDAEKPKRKDFRIPSHSAP
ncbi:MAG TPA: OstA-like protein, partial [Candidatus Kapabacteria bacterium]|nr:OstA-like protein [Candidatus Kapabacteria bacterium]